MSDYLLAERKHRHNHIFPKLPVHMRIHMTTFERNQRVKNCVEGAREGQAKLDELNSALKPKAPADLNPIPTPETMPVLHPKAMHNTPYVTTAGTAVGAGLPNPSKNAKEVRGERICLVLYGIKLIEGARSLEENLLLCAKVGITIVRNVNILMWTVFPKQAQGTVHLTWSTLCG